MADHQSPSSSVSSLSGSDVVFTQPALAANRDHDPVVDIDTDDDSSSIFSWPTVESPAAHHSSSLRPNHRALLLAGSGSSRSSRNLRSASTSSPTSTVVTVTDRRQHIFGREAEQATDPSTSLARRIAARDSARTSAPSSQQEYPTARLLSRTTISVAESDPDLRRIATTREAERQRHLREWHRLGLLDPSTSLAGPDGSPVSPGHLTYARRRSSAATARPFATLSETYEDQEDEIDVLSVDIHQRSRRLAELEALEPDIDTWLYHDQYHDPPAPLPSVSSTARPRDRRMARLRSLHALRIPFSPQWEDGRDDPNGENIHNDSPVTTPAGRLYRNTLLNAATDDLLAPTTERVSGSALLRPPGLAVPSPQFAPSPISTKPQPTVNPLPSPLDSMLLLTPKQRFATAFRASRR